MRYYKLTKNNFADALNVGRIYPENFREWGSKGYDIDCYVNHGYAHFFEEVSAGDYFVQEGIMPEYFAIKMVADNPLWKKYIDWLNMIYNRYVDGTSIMCPYYGFGGKNIWSTDLCKSKLTDFKNNPVELTLEQWDKIINKNMKDDKEIIGWKLKEDCEQYKQAALNIVNQSKFYNFAEGYNFSTNSENESTFKKAGVLELWFTPVYKQKFKEGDYVVWPDGYIGKINSPCAIYPKRWNIRLDGNKEGNYTSCHEDLLRKATPEEIKAAQYPQITINGYKGEFFDNYVKFGCAQICSEFFIELYRFIDDWKSSDISNKFIESVTIGKGTFTKDQIKEIAEYYLNK